MSVGELALAEFRLNVRSAGVRVLGVVLAAFTVLGLVSDRYGDPLMLRVGPAAAETVSAMLGGLLVILAPLIAAGAARREHRLGMEELILSKPPSSEALLWARFLGTTAALLVLIPTTLVTALAAQPLLFRGEFATEATLVGGLRAVLPVLFVSGLAFALATFARSAMVAGLVIALIIGMQAGSTYLVPALRLLMPYHLAYGLLGLALVGATGGWWESRREPARRVRPSWLAAGGCLAAALVAGSLAARSWRGWTMEDDPALARVAEWRGDRKGALPEAALRTVTGEAVRLSQWKGKPIVLVFWSTEGPDGASEAAVLERACRAAAAGRVGFASVCLAEDPLYGRDLARAAGLRDPIIWNPPPQFGEAQGLAAVFNVAELPQAMAALIRRDGTCDRRVSPVSQVPPGRPGRLPRRDWERRLSEMATRAFRQLAEGSR